MREHVYAGFEFKALDDEAGIFEAVVAVYDTVDYVGDRIVKGAFDDSLEKWEKSGTPIPIVFAHDWANLDALIGQVLEAKSVDKGLWVKAQLDLSEEFASRVYKKMKQGTLREFSIGYQPARERKAKDGVRELVEIDLFECGPCLKGVHPDTELISVKSLTVNRETLERAHEALGALLSLTEEPVVVVADDTAELAETTAALLAVQRERSIRLIEMGL